MTELHAVPSAPTPVTAVHLRVLGPLAASVAGTPVTLGGPGARSVLARLVSAAGRVVSTDLLIDDLWSGQPPPKALAALQVHVSNLRRLLEPTRAPRTPASVIVSVPPGYALRLPADSVDVWHFEQLVTAGLRESEPTVRADTLSAALDLATGEPYHEFTDAEWARAESTRLGRLRCTAVEAWAQAHLELGRPELVVDTLSRHTDDQPGREAGVRLCALALYRTGRQADALEVLRRTRTFLADELGVDPSPDLRTLEHEILRQDPALTQPAPTRRLTLVTDRPAATPDVRWNEAPATGVDDLLDEIRATAVRAAGSGLQVVWIGGDAGEGKSTLARTFTDEAAASGWRAARGNCPEVDGAPAGWPWIEALRELGEDVPASCTPFQIGQRVADLLGRPDGRTVVLLDDTHRADEPTLQILRHVAAVEARSNTLLLCTFRPAEVGSDLQATWAATAAVPGTRLMLRGLGRDGAAAIARETGLAELDDALLTELLERTNGNPLFLREYTRLLASEGVDAFRSRVPDGVRDVLGRRIARLPDRTVLELRRASVLGRESDLGTLAALGGTDDDTLLDALEPALLAGIVTEPAPDRVRFSHDLVRATLYDELPPMRRRRMHSSALTALAARSPGDLAALAHHAAAAATPATATALLHHVRAGALDAEHKAAHRDATALWRAADSLCAMADDQDPRTTVDVLAAGVGAQARTGDVVGARALRTRAVRLARELGHPDALLRAVTSWTAPVVWTIQVDPEPDREMVDAIDTCLARDDVAAADRALLLTAKVFELEGHDDRACLDAAVAARDTAAGSGDVEVRLRALNAFGYVAFGPDLVAERADNAAALLAAATEAGDDGFTCVAYFQRFLAATAVTDLEAAREHARQATELAAGHQLGQMLGVLSVYDALILLMAGRVDEGVAAYDAVSAAMAAQGVASAQWIGLIGWIGAATYAGDLSALVPVLEELESVRPQSVRFPLVVALLDAGDIRRAVSCGRPATPTAATTTGWR
ncbi:BTAD domain-containing putative transcriptional regulator [Rhodococcus triatomae]